MKNVGHLIGYERDFDIRFYSPNARIWLDAWTREEICHHFRHIARGGVKTKTERLYRAGA